MYNIVVGGQHPSTICVELDKLSDSIHNLKDVITSEFIEEGLMEFIGEFARTDEIMPDDRTLGFIIVNSDKQVLSISMSEVEEDLRARLESASEEYRKSGFRVDLDLPAKNT